MTAMVTPRSPRKRQAILGQLPRITRTDGTPIRVLLVDDEKPLLDVFSAALSSFFEITTAQTAREADFILQKKKFKVMIQ